MSKIDLTKYGITGATEVVYNPDYDTLYNDELNPSLQDSTKASSLSLEQLT